MLAVKAVFEHLHDKSRVIKLYRLTKVIQKEGLRPRPSENIKDEEDKVLMEKTH